MFIYEKRTVKNKLFKKQQQIHSQVFISDPIQTLNVYTEQESTYQLLMNTQKKREVEESRESRNWRHDYKTKKSETVGTQLTVAKSFFFLLQYTHLLTLKPSDRLHI